MQNVKWSRQNSGICQQQNCFQDSKAENKLIYKELLEKFRVITTTVNPLNSSSVGMAKLTQEYVFDNQQVQKVLYPTLQTGRVRDNVISLSKPTWGYFQLIFPWKISPARQPGHAADGLHRPSAQGKNTWHFSLFILIAALLQVDVHIH